MIDWLKWFFWEKRVCAHFHRHYQLESLGRDKVLWCDDCGTALEVNGKSLVFSSKKEHN